MRILAVTDIHASKKGEKTIRHFIKTEEPDILTISGDITHFGPAEYASRLLNSIKIRTVAVNGNCDPPEVAAAIEESRATMIVGRTIDIDGIVFRGLGYPIFNEHLAAGGTLAGGGAAVGALDVLISHAPAYGFNDFVGGHAGDRAILDFVNRTKPKLVLSGHIHEARGIMENDDTIFINPGPVKDGFAAVVEIAQSTVNANLLSLP